MSIKKVLLYCSLFLNLTSCQIICNNKIGYLNLDFENNNNHLPTNWSIEYENSDYLVGIDSLYSKSGKYSLAIESQGNIADLQAITLKLPFAINAKKITLTGYIKTKNVTDGFAGLWLMNENSDKEWKQAEVYFMQQYGITGTNEWKKHELSLDIPPYKMNEIVIGGLLTGKGKMWIDDLNIIVDGKEIKEIGYIKDVKKIKENDNFPNNYPHSSFNNLTKQDISDIGLLGRIWGFLKYHHPNIASGEYNWDYELFKFLPKYISCGDLKKREIALYEWIHRYGKITDKNLYIPKTSDFTSKPDMSWINSKISNQRLKKKLNNIYYNRGSLPNYYVETRQYVGNPIFINEPSYADIKENPDAEFRLLALFRYWNMINYFYPYKNVTDKDWDLVLEEYIPLFINSNSRLEYELTATKILCEICDTHAFLLDGWNEIELRKGFRYAPVVVKYIENKFVVTNTLNNSDFKTGDIITSIDGRLIENIADSMKSYYPASNDVVKMRDITADILRTNKYSIKIKYLSSGKTKEISFQTVERKEYLKMVYLETNASKKNSDYIDNNIGYINLGNITNDDIPNIKAKFTNAKAIIIDIRNYPPDIFNSFIPFFFSETTSYSKHLRCNINNPGEFYFSKDLVIPLSDAPYKGKLFVLVNDETQSNAEYTAMALRSNNNTVIVGSQTAGCDGNVSEITLPGGLSTYISGDGIFYPNGKETQRIGIIPDIEVIQTIAGIIECRDEVLEKALEIANHLN